MSIKFSIILCGALGLILGGCAFQQMEMPLTLKCGAIVDYHCDMCGNGLPLILHPLKCGAIVDYHCDGGDSAQARYYALSDGSLHFVKASFKDGRKYMLPNVVSASGARYFDDSRLPW